MVLGAHADRAELTQLALDRRFVPFDLTAALAGAGIGVGLLADDPDLRVWVEQLGLNPDEILAGRRRLTDRGVDVLWDLQVKRSMSWLNRQLRDAELDDARYNALLLTALSSSWKSGRPSLISTDMIAAVKEGRHDDVADLIRKAGAPKENSASAAQRETDALMYLGEVGP